MNENRDLRNGSMSISMNDQSSAVHRITERFNARLRSGFPTADINKLIPNDAEATGLLHGRIEMFLSGIAGYACRADRLKRRPEQDLRAARRFLSLSFFDKYQQYAPIRARITAQETPALFFDMETA